MNFVKPFGFNAKKFQFNTCTRFYTNTTGTRWLRTRATPKAGQRIQMPFFDAERFARLLEKEGFSSVQAKTIINALDDVVDERYNGFFALHFNRLIHCIVQSMSPMIW